jgi:hypothetical protein
MAMNETVVEPVDVDGVDVGADVSHDDATVAGTEDVAPEVASNEEGRDDTSDPGDKAAVDADVDVAGDGRQIPPALRSALNDLRLTDPKLASRLKNVWFADLALKKEFPGGLNEARALREFKERLGGDDGIQQIEQERQYFQNLDQQLVAGDAKVLEHFASVAPEGFAKLVPSAIAKLAETSPEHFEHIAGVMIAGSMPGGLMEAIHQVLAGHETTAGLAQHLANWYNPLVQTLHNAPQRRVEPERRRLEADRQQFEAGKTAEFQRGIVKEIEVDGGAQADKIIDQLSGSKLSSEAKFRLKGVITSELDAALRGDAAFLQKRDRLLAEGDRNKILTNYKAEVSKRLPEIVKKVHREFYGATRPVAKAPVDIGTGRAAQPGRQPDSNAIDWTRTSRRDVLDGKAYVKGRAEQVRW